MATPQRKIATQTIERLCELDQQTTRAYYEMGQLLFAIKQGSLWAELGYDTFAQMIEEELSFTPGTGYGYLNMYGHFKRLKYTKAQALELLNQFGLRDLQAYLPTASMKVGSRTIKRQITVQRKQRREITFWMSEGEYEEVRKTLERHGAEPTEAGRLLSSSEAFLRVIRLIKDHKAEVVPLRKTG